MIAVSSAVAQDSEKPTVSGLHRQVLEKIRRDAFRARARALALARSHVASVANNMLPRVCEKSLPLQAL